MKTVKQEISVADDLELQFISDKDNGEILDTQVLVVSEFGNDCENIALCWIAGNQIENFTNEFRALIAKYRI